MLDDVRIFVEILWTYGIIGVTIYSSYKAVKTHNQQSTQIRQSQSSYESKGTVQSGRVSGRSYAAPTSANQTGSFSYYNARDNKTVTFTSAADYFAYKKLCDELDALDKNLASQIVHNTLDAVGVIPGVGEVADALNGVVYLAEGDKASAALSFVSCVPLAGDAIGKGAKNAGKLLGIASDSAKHIDDFAEVGQTLAKNGDELVEAVVDSGDEAIDAIKNTIKNGDGATDAVKSTIKSSDNTNDIVKSTSKNTNSTADLAQNMETDKEPVTIVLKYKDGWTDAQKAAADAKVKALTEAHTEKMGKIERNGPSASKIYKNANGAESVPKGSDVDHVIDLQLGGANDISNMNPLDSSVNRSLGAQIMHAIKDYPVGTVFGDFIIE